MPLIARHHVSFATKGCVGPAIIAVLRAALFLLLSLGAVASALAQVPQLQVAQDQRKINLTELMVSQRVPLAPPIDPDALWEGAAGEAVPAAPYWHTGAGHRLVGRVVLVGSRERDVYVVQVPSASVDEVQVWFRMQGSAWKSAMAGDRVALSRWPFASQSPAVAIAMREEPVELMVMVANASSLRVPVWIMSDQEFRENQIRQANLSGVIMGLGLMVLVVTVIGAVLLGRRANWLLTGVSAWVLATVMCLNGYMAVWFTPEWPAFNDACKHFVGVLLGALIVAVTAEALDQRYLSRAEKLLKIAVPLVALLYASAQAAWFPGEWRPPGALVWSALTLLACAAMCVHSALRGGRYIRWIAAAVACFGIGVLLVYSPFDFVGGLDVRAAIVGVLLFASMLLYYQALFARERYGRDVLGRAAIAASRDPLTALLSHQGFQQAYDQVLLKQGAVRGKVSVMLFYLPGLEQSGIEHGFVLAERGVVRFAACLQGVLGDAWSIGRLSKTRFACIGMAAARPDDVLALATRVLTTCTRLTEAPTPVADFDLRIACTQRQLRAADHNALMHELEQAARAIGQPKRIVMV